MEQLKLAAVACLDGFDLALIPHINSRNSLHIVGLKVRVSSPEQGSPFQPTAVCNLGRDLSSFCGADGPDSWPRRAAPPDFSGCEEFNDGSTLRINSPACQGGTTIESIPAKAGSAEASGLRAVISCPAMLCFWGGPWRSHNSPNGMPFRLYWFVSSARRARRHWGAWQHFWRACCLPPIWSGASLLSIGRPDVLNPDRWELVGE